MNNSFLFLMAAMLVGTWSYPTGAPDEVCNDPHLTPLHGKPPKDPTVESPPYTVTAASTSYQPDQKIEVIISGMNGTVFIGFAAAGMNEKGEIIGSWQEGKEVHEVMKCHVATHTSKSDKKSINLIWKAPGDKKGTVRFVVTVVKTGYDFWVDLPVLVKDRKQ